MSEESVRAKCGCGGVSVQLGRDIYSVATVKIVGVTMAAHSAVMWLVVTMGLKS